MKQQIEKRGAELCLKSICEVYQKDIEMIIPELIQAPLSQIDQTSEINSHDLKLTHVTNKDFSQNLIKLVEQCEANLPKYQDFVHHLQLIEFLCLCGELNNELLREKFLNKINKLNLFIKCPLSGVRNLVCRSIAAICSQEITDSMDLILEFLIDLLDNSEFDLFARQGNCITLFI